MLQHSGKDYPNQLNDLHTIYYGCQSQLRCVRESEEDVRWQGARGEGRQKEPKLLLRVILRFSEEIIST